MEDIRKQSVMLRNRLEALIQVYFGPNFCDEVKEYTVQHPFVAIALGIIAVFSALPVGIFLCFASITVFISVICFIFVGGSVLVCGGLVLIGIVSFITFITVSLTSAAAIAYWFAQRLHHGLCGNVQKLPSPMNNLSAETNNHSNPSPQPANNGQNCNVDPDSPSDSTPVDSTENYEVVG